MNRPTRRGCVGAVSLTPMPPAESSASSKGPGPTGSPHRPPNSPDRNADSYSADNYSPSEHVSGPRGPECPPSPTYRLMCRLRFRSAA